MQQLTFQFEGYADERWRPVDAGAATRRTSVTIREGLARASAWLGGKAQTVSALCGEDFTRRDVLLAQAAAAALLIILGIVGSMEGGAL